MTIIRAFNPTDDEYQAISEVQNAVWPEYPDTPENLRLQDKNRVEEHFHAHLVAEVDGRIVADCDYGHTSWSFGPNKYFVGVTVHPEFQRQGIGGAMYEQAVSDLKARGCEKIEGFTREDVTEGVKFLEKRGFEMKTREPVSYLDPATFDPAPFAGAVERAEAAGVRIVTLGELMANDPDHLKKLYDMTNEILADVPWHDVSTPFPFDVWVKRFEENPNRLPDGYFVALDGDQYIGLSALYGNQVTDKKLFTGLTGVVRSHRRMGLATAMKLQAIEYARTRLAADGSVPVIETDNEEGNPMLQINKALGFVEKPAWLSYVKDYSTGEKPGGGDSESD